MTITDEQMCKYANDSSRNIYKLKKNAPDLLAHLHVSAPGIYAKG
jgi:hypothetical protein